MKEKDTTILQNRLSRKIESCSLSKEELYRLCQILQERNDAAADIEVANYKKTEDTQAQSQENFRLLREAFHLRVTVVGDEGQELYGSIDEVFGSTNFPDKIHTFYVNSETILKAFYNWVPRNSFSLLIDFTKPALFDFSILPSNPTPNNSHFVVAGHDSTWVNGVFNEVVKFFEKRKTSLTLLHKQSIYDFLVWIIGIPFAFWLSYKLSSVLNDVLFNYSVFVKSAAYVYVFLIALFGIRLLFHYARWIWPLVEYKSGSDTATKHRAFLGLLLIGLLITCIYDIIRYMAAK